MSQDYPNLKIVVLNNHSPDPSDELIEKEFPQVELIKSQENLGFARGHNAIWRKHPDELYLCLNVDIILEPGFISGLVSGLLSHPKAGAVSGKLLRWDFSKNEKTKTVDTAGLKLHATHCVTDIGAGEVDQGQYDGTREVFGVSGAAFLIRPKVMKELEGFEEMMFMYKEDVDLMFRMQWLGYKAFVIGKAVAYHDRTEAKGGISRRVRGMSFLHHRIMLKKNWSPDFPLSVRLATGFYEFLKGVYTFFTNLSFFFIWHHIKKEVKSSPKRVNASEIIKWINQ